MAYVFVFTFTSAVSNERYLQIQADLASNTNRQSTPTVGEVDLTYQITSTLPSVKYYYFGSQRVAMRGGNDVYYLHGDHLGSTSLTTNVTGTVVAEIRHHPFGEVRWESGSRVTDFGFTGQREEVGFGLMDYNARFYSPLLGRFISPDTFILERASSGGFNRYRYVQNNPLKYTDPSGHFECEHTSAGNCKPPQTSTPFSLPSLSIELNPLPSLTDEQKEIYAQGLDAEVGVFRRTPVQNEAYAITANVVANHMRNGVAFDEAITIIDTLNPNKPTIYKGPEGLEPPSQIGLDTVKGILDGSIEDTTDGALHWVDRTYWQKYATEAYPQLDGDESLSEYMKELQAQNPDMVSVEYEFPSGVIYSLHAFSGWPPPQANIVLPE